MEKLVEQLTKLAKEANELAKKYNETKWTIGYYEGKRDGYILAAKWLEEELIKEKYEKIFQK